MTPRRPTLASRLMLAQVLVVGTGAVTLVIAALLVAPGLFHEHLVDAGIDSAEAQLHAEEAFASSFGISVAVAAGAALICAGLVSWFFVRRVSGPVEELAKSAEVVAAGRYDVDVPDATFSRELHQLSESFTHLAQRLSDAESTRSRLLANLAHELRTPLATLEAYIDGMEDDVVPDTAANWTTMRDQVDRLRRLARDLRESAAAEEHAIDLDLERIDARTVARAAVAGAAPRFHAKGVTLDRDEQDTECWIVADSVRLQQVLANLLDNALRHTRVSGRVRVLTRMDAAHVRIEVEDDGEGVPPEQLDRIFDRFYRVDASRHNVDGSGSGLGLTIARAIVAEHGGSVDAASDGSGKGATFTVVLPRSG